MTRFIKLKDHEARKAIAKHFSISLANLSQILNFHRNGIHAEKIREMAKQKGGKLIEEVEIKEVRVTKVLDSKGNIKQIINE